METISVDRTSRHTTAKMSVHLQVKMLGITVYRFEQDSTETWNGDQLDELSSDTTDNGKRHTLRVSRQGSSLQRDADSMVSTITPDSLPATLCLEPHFQTATLIHSVDGHLLHVTAQKVGMERIPIGNTQAEVTHYMLSGDLTDDLWYDADGTLVQRRSTATDHSVIQFTMR